MTDTYNGDVVYSDGWHWSVNDNGEPDQRLFLDDDGSYRYATDQDESWHARKHQQFASVQMEDGQPGVRVTAEEMQAIEQLLNERRGGE